VSRLIATNRRTSNGSGSENWNYRHRQCGLRVRNGRRHPRQRARNVLINRTRKTARAVATDMRYGTSLGPKVDIFDGDYDDLKGAGIVLITAGVNEKTGGATDRNDPQGRL
jgi:hypothetical protein